MNQSNKSAVSDKIRLLHALAGKTRNVLGMIEPQKVEDHHINGLISLQIKFEKISADIKTLVEDNYDNWVLNQQEPDQGHLF